MNRVMSLLDITMEWLSSPSTESIIPAIIGLALIVFIVIFFIVSLRKLLISKEKSGYDITNVQSWPPEIIVSFMLSFAVILLILAIPSAILVSNSGSEFLTTFVQIMVALGTLIVVIVSLGALSQARDATKKMQRESWISRQLDFKMKQIEDLYSLVTANYGLFLNIDLRRSKREYFLQVINDVGRHIYLASPRFQKAWSNWAKVVADDPDADTLIISSGGDYKGSEEAKELIKIAREELKILRDEIFELQNKQEG
jgi:hypothetical protein